MTRLPGTASSFRVLPSLRRLLLTLLALSWLGAPGHAAIERQPYLQLLTPDSVTIVWTTDTATDSQVNYGTVVGSPTDTVLVAGSTTDHEVKITDLNPGTTYYYDVGSSTTVEAGGMSDYHFTTAPVEGSATPFSFWVVGDSGSATNSQRNVRDAMMAETGNNPPDLYIHVGDIAYNDGTHTQLTDNHFAIYNTESDILRRRPFWPTLGNHDAITLGGQPYYDSFVLPTGFEAGGVPSGTEAYYSFNYANVHFIVLNSHNVDRSANGPMATWLEADLASNCQPWIIAIWHHPPYSKGTHDSDAEGRLVEMRENILPILEAGGLDLNLTGHSHAYERSYLIDGFYATPTTVVDGTILDAGNGLTSGTDPFDNPADGAYMKLGGNNANDGAVYVVSGHGGRSVGGSGGHPVMFYHEVAFGSVIINVDDNSLTLKNLRANAVADRAVTDEFTIVKGDTPTFSEIHRENFEDGFTLGQPVGAHPDWFDGGTGPLVTAGNGVAGSIGLAAGSSIFTWTAHPFDWNDPDFIAFVVEADFETDGSGDLDDDRVGWMITDSNSSSSNIFGVQVDPETPGDLRIEGYWDGPFTNDQRPLIVDLPALGANTWYRLHAKITKLTATSARIDVSFTELDADGGPAGPPLATGTILDTSDTAGLGTEEPGSKYFTAPSIWPAYNNFTAAPAAFDNAHAKIITLGSGAVCGNGSLDPGEECDDGNPTPGDGCANCIIEFCGDGTAQAGLGEECDDGGTVNGDGCDANCIIEFCGDGTAQAGLGEECDDGNTTPGDGCDENCVDEVCGNGVVQAGEECDDGNTTPGDGCDENCVDEVCGNGVVQAGEECDDGNTMPGDGCDANCLIECGNGNPDPGEECDDGNTTPGDGCDANCQREGLLACDDFNRSGPDLGVDWSVVNLAMDISNNKVRETGPTASQPAQALWVGDATHAADQFGKICLVDASPHPFGFVFRGNDADREHYEVHLKSNSMEWRWERYDSVTGLWDGTMDSCAADPLSPGDYVGATVVGTGPATVVSVWRWDTDPGTDISTWGLADCELSASAGNFVDIGNRVGIRAYGSSALTNSGDDWCGGDIGLAIASAPPPVPDGGSGTQPLLADKLDPAGTQIQVSWDDQCAPSGTKILYGPLSQVSTYGTTGAVCGISNPQLWDPAPAGDLWFVLVSDDGAGVESSWGLATAGERNGLTSSGTCGSSSKDISATCP